MPSLCPESAIAQGAALVASAGLVLATPGVPNVLVTPFITPKR